jgi:apolipoprotein N-acyltransferase
MISGLLLSPKRVILFIGFFWGLFWVYWFGFSFQYYSLTYLIPVVSFIFAMIVLVFTIPLAYIKQIWLRALLIFLFSFTVQFDTNWIQPEYMLVYSYFGVQKWQFGIILFALALFWTLYHDNKFSNYKKFAPLPLLLLLLSGNYSALTSEEKNLLPLKIKLYDTNIQQDRKWSSKERLNIIQENLAAIDSAINKEYDVIVLPESAFPLYMNHYPHIQKELEKRAHNINIVTGALLQEREDGKHAKNFNVTYIFTPDKTVIAKKTLLVPFGEYIPLPIFLQEWVNQTFFDGISDFVTAKDPTYIDINGTQFLNAICYEALCEEMFVSHPKYMIATSNNGWFLPSTEPTHQKIMMQYLSNKYGTIIYHSANRAGTGIILPQ